MEKDLFLGSFVKVQLRNLFCGMVQGIQTNLQGILIHGEKGMSVCEAVGQEGN